MRFTHLSLSPLLFVALASAGHAQTYTLTDLGTLGGKISAAKAINASGQISGTSTNAAGNSHGFIYSGGVMQDIGTLGGTTSEVGDSISSSGQIVGDSSTTGNLHTHAFSYTGGAPVDIGTLGGGVSEAFGVNDLGQIVGISNISGNNYRVFLYSGGVMQNLGTLGGNYGFGIAINNSGIIVGAANTAAETEHAFVYTGGVMHDLGTIGSDYGSAALSINSSGQIAGYSYHTGTTNQAFVVNGGVMTGLGFLTGNDSVAHCINDAGVIVGYANTNVGAAHGFVYYAGAMHDLNSLLDASGSGWTVTVGQSVNNNGWIAATATNAAGASRAVLLKPAATPEPGTLLGVGLGLVVCWRRGKAGR